MVVLPPRYKKLIAAEMKNRGPRAVIEAMTHAMLPGIKTNNDAMIAIERMQATLLEILKHWPEDEKCHASH
jgi:hypothetical protein